MDKLSNQYPNHLIFNNKYNDKEKLIYFETLIRQAYDFNPSFKKFDKECVKNNLDLILKQMKDKYYQSSPETIISIISVLHLWTRNNLPTTFQFDHDYSYFSRIKKLKLIENINFDLYK